MYKNVYSSVQTKSSSSAAIDDASSCSFAPNIGKVIRKVIPQRRVNTFHTFHKLHRLDGRLKTHYAVCQTVQDIMVKSRTTIYICTKSLIRNQLSSLTSGNVSWQLRNRHNGISNTTFINSHIRRFFYDLLDLKRRFLMRLLGLIGVSLVDASMRYEAALQKLIVRLDS